MYLLTAVDSTMEKQHQNMIIMGTFFLKEKERTFQYSLWYIETPSVWIFNNFFIDNDN